MTLLRRWFAPAPDSAVADALRCGKSPWKDAVHLLWSAWLFLTPLFDSDGYGLQWLGLTLLSYPVFLLLYARVLLAPRRHGKRYALGMVALSLVLLGPYPSGMSYFVFGCVMLRITERVPLWRYLLEVAALNAVLAAVVMLQGYPWQILAWMLPMTLVIGTIVNIDVANQHSDAVLRLSQEEVRRLAATAERERIGRDLHDLLGHTLSLITLKLELSRKLIDRDPGAARIEIAEAEKVARHALTEVRAAVTGFRATDLAAEFASARLLLESSRITLEYEPSPELPGEVERTLALVLREAATNIARHSQASYARVAVEHAGAHVRMRVSDDGRGCSGAEGNGLAGMRERLRQLGGTLALASSRNGTVLEIEVPLPGAAPGAGVEPAPVAAGSAA